MIMMVGLPSAGKTTWALKHHSTHSEKRYTFLGTKYIMDKMRVGGVEHLQTRPLSDHAISCAFWFVYRCQGLVAVAATNEWRN